jgi:hypothetical protein
MGNALGCAGLGERLAAAARDGDAAEARRLLAADPGLARCTATFGNLSSPLHLAASKGHHEVRTWQAALTVHTSENTCMLVADNAVQDDSADFIHGGQPAVRP